MHLQGGTHEETSLPVVLIVDGTPRLVTEAGVGLGVVKVELAKLEIFELVDGKA